MPVFTAAATALLAGTFLAGSAIATGVVAAGLAVGTQYALSYALQAVSGRDTPANKAAESFSLQTQVTVGGAVPRSFLMRGQITDYSHK